MTKNRWTLFWFAQAKLAGKKTVDLDLELHGNVSGLFDFVSKSASCWSGFVEREK